MKLRPGRATQRHTHLPPPSPLALMMAVCEALREQLDRAERMERERANAIALPLRLQGEKTKLDLPDISWVAQCDMDKLTFAELLQLEFPEYKRSEYSIMMGCDDLEIAYGEGKLKVADRGCTYMVYKGGRNTTYINYTWSEDGLCRVYLSIGENKQHLDAIDLEHTDWGPFLRQMIIDGWKLSAGPGLVASLSREHRAAIDRERMLQARLVRQ